MVARIHGKQKVKTDNKIISVKMSYYILKICTLNFGGLVKNIQILNVILSNII